MDAPKLYELSATFTQENDTCQSGDDEGQEITVATQNMGDGSYIYIKTKRWALNDDEIDAFAAMLKNVLKAKIGKLELDKGKP